MRLVTPIDLYRMAERSVKYEALWLFELLKNQDYALLIGSVGLFLILALVMYLTRKVDWNAAGA